MRLPLHLWLPLTSSLAPSAAARVPQLVAEEAVHLLQTFSEPLPLLPGFENYTSRKLPNIPDDRRSHHEEHVDRKRANRLLIFWAVGSTERCISLVGKNIDHARRFEKGQRGVKEPLHIDVYLAHYDFNRSGWQDVKGDWYSRNVRFSAEHKGVKFWLAKDLLLWQYTQEDGENMAHMSNMRLSELPVVDLHSYEYLWFLDEDVDFNGLDLRRMVDLARRTRSNILTPSIIMKEETAPWRRNLTNQTSEDEALASVDETVVYSSSRRTESSAEKILRVEESPNMDNLQRQEGMHGASYGDSAENTLAAGAQEQIVVDEQIVDDAEERLSSGCQYWDTTCELQRPNSTCEFRYTNFVEVSFPLLKPEAFVRVLHECKTCLHYPGTIWGLDHVWCARSARTWIGRYTACAVLDSVNVHHLNHKTLPKWKVNSTTGEREIDWTAYYDVRATENTSWAWNVTTLYCSLNRSSRKSVS